MGNSNADAQSEKSKYSSVVNAKAVSEYSFDQSSPRQSERIKLINNMNNKNIDVGQGIQVNKPRQVTAKGLRDSRQKDR